MLVDGLKREKVIIAFNRKRNGTDIQLPIDTSVVKTSSTGERTRSPEPSTEFFECVQQLLESLRPTGPKVGSAR